MRGSVEETTSEGTKKKSREERLYYEEELAIYELKKLEASHFAKECLYSGNRYVTIVFLLVFSITHQLSKWEQKWDEWNEVHVWENINSGETIWDKPNPPLCPLMPQSLIDATTDKSLSPKTIRRNKADSSSDEDSIVDTESMNTGAESISKKAKKIPLGRDAEFELASKRVQERRMRLAI